MWRIILIVAIVVIASLRGIAQTQPQPHPLAQRYFVVDGADYRDVTPATFANMRATCARVERKHYPIERIDVNICNI